MTGWYAERTPDRSAKVVIAVTLLALLLVAAVPVALLAGVVMMLLGHLNEVCMRAVSFRAWARAWSSPVPAAKTWPRERGISWKRCPDPRPPQGRIYPLACLIAIALCAFTAAGNDRFTAAGQCIRRAGQADPARLRAPVGPDGRQYRAPDQKTIRVVLDRLDPRALARALLDGRRGRGRLRAVAVDGKTCRGGRRTDGCCSCVWSYGAGIEQAPHRLVGDPGDHVIVAVDMQHLGSVQFGGRGDD